MVIVELLPESSVLFDLDARKTASVFVIATANNINSLPAELLRKGRFDEIFFVDLPTQREREEIFKLHLSKDLKTKMLQVKLKLIVTFTNN